MNFWNFMIKIWILKMKFYLIENVKIILSIYYYYYFTTLKRYGNNKTIFLFKKMF